MRVVGNSTGRRKWWPRLILFGAVILIALAGLGVFQREYLRQLRHDPKGLLVDAPRNYLEARFRAPQLGDLHVHMKFKHYEKILERREEALRIGLLQARDSDEVPAELEFDGERIPVRMRLKGDWPDHFQTEKWSYRIKTRKGGYYRGMRRFSIQHPEAREYLGEWLYLAALRSEGVLAPGYSFVNVIFNGESMGIMSVEEHFAKELLERQGRRQGPIAKFDEDPYWEQRRIARNEHGIRWFDLDYLQFDNADISFFGERKLREDPVLSEQMLAARQLLEAFQSGTASASEIFEIESMARFLAISRVFGADHALIWHNLRFYFDPVTARLEPIGFDGEPSGWNDEQKVRTHLVDGYQMSLGLGGWYPWIPRFLEDDQAMAAYLQALWRYSSPSWTAGLKERLGAELEELVFALRLEWPRLENPFPALQKGQAYFRGKLDLDRPLRARHRVAEDGTPSLELGNLSDLPREVVAVLLDSEALEIEVGQIIPARMPLESIRYVEIPLDGIRIDDGSKLEVVHRTIGIPETETSEPSLRREPSNIAATILPKAPRPADLAASLPWLEWDPIGRKLISVAGSWRVEDDLILPSDVVTEFVAGTTLLFAPDIILFARAPLNFLGSVESPIRLLPQEETWGSLVLVGAGEMSTWEHLEIRGTTSLERPGWIMPGGVTIQDSPIEMTECRFEGHQGEDALNIMQTSFRMVRCVIGDCPSDAFDGDFVEGILIDCSFYDVGGDAIDFSGSIIEVRGFRAARILDKAISAGESSWLQISDFIIEDASIGIASKDLSEVIARNGVMHDVKIGLAAYTKKPGYGPALLIAERVEITGHERQTLVHTGSRVRLDGVTHDSSEFDVKELYRLGILGN